MQITQNDDGSVTLTEGTYTNTREERTCGYCGKRETEVGEVSYHSGNEECWPCWNWRKLDSPAAHHWAPRFKALLENVDMHDMMTFFPETLGFDKDEAGILFKLVKRAHVNCDHAIALRLNMVHDKIARREAEAKAREQFVEDAIAADPMFRTRSTDS